VWGYRSSKSDSQLVSVLRFGTFGITVCGLLSWEGMEVGFRGVRKCVCIEFEFRNGSGEGHPVTLALEDKWVGGIRRPTPEMFTNNETGISECRRDGVRDGVNCQVHALYFMVKFAEVSIGVP